MFQIVEQPNDFIKESKNNKSSDAINKRQSERVEFWTNFNEHIINRGKPFNVRKATTDHWYDIAIGTSAAHISVTLVNKESYVGVELYISSDKELFDKLYKNREDIEKQLDFKLEWLRLDNAKASRILHKINGLNFDDHSNYDSLIEEAIDKVIKMKSVFKDKIK